MDDNQKQMILSCAMQYLSDEYFETKGTHAELHELGAWLQPMWANQPDILEIIDRRHKLSDIVISKKIAGDYPTFWNDLWMAVQDLKIPRSQRPERTVT